MPISPNDIDLRMIRYLMESLRRFGGPIGKAASCILSVGADEPPRNLRRDYPWIADYPLEIRWVDRDLFRRWSYDATGFDRLWVRSHADVVALIDADLLVAGDFDSVVLQAHQRQQMLGFMAHISPFGLEGLAATPSDVWWSRVFESAGLTPPSLDRQFSGWGLDFSSVWSQVVSRDPNHRWGPLYFNYGFVIGPRVFWERVGQTYVQELESVGRVLDSGYRSQIANCLAFRRHNIPCDVLSINYNFPLNVPTEAMRTLNPDSNGENDDNDIKVFHYIANRYHFKTPESVRHLLNRQDLTGAWRVFQSRLRNVNEALGDV